MKRGPWPGDLSEYRLVRLLEVHIDADNTLDLRVIPAQVTTVRVCVSTPHEITERLWP